MTQTRGRPAVMGPGARDINTPAYYNRYRHTREIEADIAAAARATRHALVTIENELRNQPRLTSSAAHTVGTALRESAAARRGLDKAFERLNGALGILVTLLGDTGGE